MLGARLQAGRRDGGAVKRGPQLGVSMVGPDDRRREDVDHFVACGQGPPEAPHVRPQTRSAQAQVVVAGQVARGLRHAYAVQLAG